MWEIFASFLEHFQNNPFVQITWFTAMGITLIAYMQKDDVRVKKLLLLTTLLWGTHFYLLGMYSWLAANAIWIVRFFLSTKFWRDLRAFVAVICLTFIVSLFTVEITSPLSALPIIASVLWAFSYFFLEQVRLRFAMLLNSTIWIIYHIHIGSLTGIINNIMIQVILMFTIYRMIHPMWWTQYYAQKVREILWKTRRPDYDTFIFIYDKVSQYRKNIWTYFLEILDYDLKQFFQNKNCKKWIEHLHKRIEL